MSLPASCRCLRWEPALFMRRTDTSGAVVSTGHVQFVADCRYAASSCQNEDYWALPVHIGVHVHHLSADKCVPTSGLREMADKMGLERERLGGDGNEVSIFDGKRFVFNESSWTLVTLYRMLLRWRTFTLFLLLWKSWNRARREGDQVNMLINEKWRKKETGLFDHASRHCMQVWAQLLLHEAGPSNNAAALPEAVCTSGINQCTQHWCSTVSLCAYFHEALW